MRPQRLLRRLGTRVGDSSNDWLTLTTKPASEQAPDGISKPWHAAKGPGGGSAAARRGGSSACARSGGHCTGCDHSASAAIFDGRCWLRRGWSVGGIVGGRCSAQRAAQVAAPGIGDPAPVPRSRLRTPVPAPARATKAAVVASRSPRMATRGRHLPVGATPLPGSTPDPEISNYPGFTPGRFRAVRECTCSIISPASCSSRGLNSLQRSTAGWT